MPPQPEVLAICSLQPCRTARSRCCSWTAGPAAARAWHCTGALGSAARALHNCIARLQQPWQAQPASHGSTGGGLYLEPCLLLVPDAQPHCSTLSMDLLLCTAWWPGRGSRGTLPCTSHLPSRWCRVRLGSRRQSLRSAHAVVVLPYCNRIVMLRWGCFVTLWLLPAPCQPDPCTASAACCRWHVQPGRGWAVGYAGGGSLDPVIPQGGLLEHTHTGPSTIWPARWLRMPHWAHPNAPILTTGLARRAACRHQDAGGAGEATGQRHIPLLGSPGALPALLRLPPAASSCSAAAALLRCCAARPVQLQALPNACCAPCSR